MAKCEICGKGVTFGIKLSHSHRRTNRPFKPNVQKVKAVVDGTPCRVHACTRCLRSGKVTRAVKQIGLPADNQFRTETQTDLQADLQVNLQEIAEASL